MVPEPVTSPLHSGRVHLQLSAPFGHMSALCMQALPLPPRGSGFDPNNPEEVELWRLQQGLAREREYHQLAKRKAGKRRYTQEGACSVQPLLRPHYLHI